MMSKKEEKQIDKEALEEKDTNDNPKEVDEEVVDEEETADSKKDKKGLFKKNNKEIENLKLQIDMLKESLLRNQAELQNYKRRKNEEVEKILRYKDEEIIKELLMVLDNFERAIKMDDNDLSDEVSRFLEGFKLIYTNMINILNKFDVKEIEAEGVEFNPDYHHAVLTDHDENKPEGVVLEVLQKGYMYKDRVVRAAMVKVNE
jgi:molecular chaperone GrpE